MKRRIVLALRGYNFGCRRCDYSGTAWTARGVTSKYLLHCLTTHGRFV